MQERTFRRKWIKFLIIDMSLSHIAVLPKQVRQLAESEKKGLVYLDGTLGRGGHARLLMDGLDIKKALLIDRDPLALENAETWLEAYRRKGIEISLHHRSFEELSEVLKDENLSGIDLALLDLGVSSPQIDDASRGFSFLKPGPLDMRMNPKDKTSAADLIARSDEETLAKIIYEYGEEHASRKIAKAIVAHRQCSPIRDTHALASLIESVIPRRGKIHPATKTFQALRIAVNRELDQLKEVLEQIPKLLNPEGRVLFISFHSLEDRLVKHAFMEWKKEGLGQILTKKCVTAEYAEIKQNSRSRSAKLRAFMKAAA